MHKADELRTLLSGKRILIAGYGREGKSSERLIRQLCPAADLTIAEGNDTLQREAERGYDLILKSPGIPTFVFEGHCDLTTLSSQTDLFLQVYHDQVVGVTGTKGKSTTTALIAAMLRTKYPDVIMAGNMGIPLFDIIPQIRQNEPIVCEFSCHQLENIHRGPHIGVLLNLHQEHLDHYHSYEDYKRAKLQIFLKQQRGNDWFFYCDEDPDSQAMMNHLRCDSRRDVGFGLHSVDQLPDEHLSPALRGDHNRRNIAAALWAVHEYQLDMTAVAEVLQHFQGLAHRMQRVGTFRNVTFYNDSIATIPAATIAACNALKQVDTLILGGFDRGIDYDELTHFLETSAISNLVFVGKAGQRMREGYKGNANTLMENDYAKIVAWCFAHTAPGRICLLSPAAASYDQFKNFEERGSTFMQLVQQYAQR